MSEIKNRKSFEPSNKADPTWWWNSPLDDIWTDVEFEVPKGFEIEKKKTLTYIQFKDDGVVRVRLYAKRVVPDQSEETT